MFRYSVVLACLFTLIETSVAQPDTISFSGKNWTYDPWQYSNTATVVREYSPTQHDTIRFVGFEFYSKRWFRKSNVWVDSSSDHKLHIRFERIANFYYWDGITRNPADPLSHLDSMQMKHDTLVAWRHYFHELPGNVGKDDSIRCVSMLEAMNDEHIWISSDIRMTEPVRYGKYTWEVASAIGTFHPQVDPGLWIWDDNNPDSFNEIDFEFCKWSDVTRNCLIIDLTERVA